jgi:hypothetical protein
MKVFAAIALLPALLVHSATTGPERQQPAAQAAPYTYQGTVQTVQPGDRSLALITGVGLALRLVHIKAAPSARIENAGSAISFNDVKPGDVVRAECRKTEAGLVADRIEKLRKTS